MCVARADGTDERRPAQQNRDALLALCELYPKNQVIPIFVMRNREISSTVRGENYRAYVPASGSGGSGSTAEEFFVTPIVIDREDIYPVVAPNDVAPDVVAPEAVPSGTGVSSEAAPAAPA